MQKTIANRTMLLEGVVSEVLIKLSIPMIFGILSMVIYNLADTFFVGRLGKEQLAALSFTFPVVLTISSLAQGIGMGTSAAISRTIGREDYQRVRRLSTDSLILGLVVVGAAATAGLLTIRPLFTLLGAGGIVLEYIYEYMSIWYIGMIFVVFPMVGNNIIRATGDTMTPGIIMVCGAAVNVILDPLLIFGIGGWEGFGIRGAATATLIGRSSTFIMSMSVLVFREKLLSFEIPGIRKILESWKEILHVGIPNAGAKMIIPLGNGFITRIVAMHGTAAVAGYGVATRIEFFSLAALNALSAVMGPFTGQNLGAGKINRVKAGFRVGGIFSLITGAAFFLVYLVFAKAISSLFSNDPEVVSTAAIYLRIVSIAYAAQGFFLIVNSGLNVLKRPFLASGLSLLEIFGLSVPLACLGSQLFGLYGVFSAVSFSYLVTGTLGLFAIRGVLKRYER